MYIVCYAFLSLQRILHHISGHLFFSYRAKYHRLKYGTDVSPEKVSKEEDNVNQEPHKDGTTNNTKPGMNWRQGRQLLRQ